MTAKKSLAQRLGRVLEAMTRQSGRLRDGPDYGSWLLGRVSESQRRRRVRIQVILTVLLVAVNLIGIAVTVLIVTVAFPVPNVFRDAPLWISFVVVPAYIVVALAVGIVWITRRAVSRLRWAIEERKPTPADERNTFLGPLRIAVRLLLFWGVAAALLTTLYGLSNSLFIPRFLFVVSFCGVLVATSGYLITEFALRPVAAQAL
jgi:adenylate cyclase